MTRIYTATPDETLNTLRLGAFALFGRYGYEGVSVGDIAKRAHLSKGALYWHYSGKEALYLDCLGILHSIFQEHVFEPMQRAPSGLEGVVVMFNGIVELFTDPRIKDGIVGFWIIPDTPETNSLIAAQTQFENECCRLIEANLRRATAEGSMNFGTDLEDFARAVLSVIEACLLPMRRLDAQELRAQITVLARTLLRAYALKPEALKLMQRHN